MLSATTRRRSAFARWQGGQRPWVVGLEARRLRDLRRALSLCSFALSLSVSFVASRLLCFLYCARGRRRSLLCQLALRPHVVVARCGGRFGALGVARHRTCFSVLSSNAAKTIVVAHLGFSAVASQPVVCAPVLRLLCQSDVRGDSGARGLRCQRRARCHVY